MSIASNMLDSTQVHRLSSGDFGEDEKVTLVDTVPSLRQGMSINEALQYGVEGQRSMHIVFFASDPGILNGDWLRVTTAASEVYDMKVLDTDKDANPSHTRQLWYAIGEQLKAGEFPSAT